MVRKRRTRGEIKQLVAEFVGSGMRRSEFCRSRGLAWGTLNRHLKGQRRKRRTATPGGQLVAVELAGSNRTRENNTSGLTLVLASGRGIEVGPGFDEHTLERLVSWLEGV